MRPLQVLQVFLLTALVICSHVHAEEDSPSLDMKCVENSLSKSQDVDGIVAACYSESSAAKSDPAVTHALKQELTNMKDDYEAVTKELSDPGREEKEDVVDYGNEASEMDNDDSINANEEIVQRDPAAWGSRRRSSWSSRRRASWSSRRRASWSSRRRTSWSSRRRSTWSARRRASWSSRRRWSSTRRRWLSTRRRWSSTRRRWLSTRRRWSTRRRLFRRRTTRRRSWRRRSIRRRTWRRRTWRRRTWRRRTWRRRITRRRRLTRRRIRRRRSSRRRLIRRRRISRRRVTRRRIRRRRLTRRRSRTICKRSGQCKHPTPNYLKVTKGQVTFNSEGNNNKKSHFYSKKPHVPGRWSGVTIGRGYDMGQKSKAQVIRDLTKAGMSQGRAKQLAAGAGLKGQSARNFLKNNHLTNVEITGLQQKNLFKISYGRQEAEAKRLSQKYYKTNWNSLNSKMQQILVDLKFRGDLRPTSSAVGQRALAKAVEENNLQKFQQVMNNRSYWSNVPSDRFNRRKKFLQNNSG
eukprot:Seg3730.2 transcript_id=Seg3730.2/GoldUCD/mRNA.D3Y31 product="hypothetical protein" protein_id=Seg3730.2/GoldUCD/D3Y31